MEAKKGKENIFIFLLMATGCCARGIPLSSERNDSKTMISCVGESSGAIRSSFRPPEAQSTKS